MLLVWKILKSILQGTKFEKYGLLIESLVYSVKFDSIEYSRSGIVTLPVSLLSVLKKSDLLKPIPAVDREGMFELLKENMPEDTSSVELTEIELRFFTRELIIPVSIPQVHVVHTVEMKLPQEDHFVVGKSIPISIFIQSYTDWAPMGDDTLTLDSRFIYDIAANESWAVSGKKKAYFDLREKQNGDITLTLIPLRTGKLELPRINIQPHESVPESVTMEINYRNEYQSALVVPEFDRLTLSF